MAERLREISQLTSRGDHTPPREGRHRSEARAGARTFDCASAIRPCRIRLSTNQKLQARNAPSPGGNPSSRFLGVIAEDQARPRGDDVRSREPCRKSADRTAAENRRSAEAKAGIKSLGSVGLHEAIRVRCRIRCGRRRRGSHPGPCASGRSGSPRRVARPTSPPGRMQPRP